MDDEAIIKLVLDREPYLSYLSQRPAKPRDLVDTLGDSRATVHRATDELSEHGLIKRGDHGKWRLTPKGDLVYGTVDNTRDIVDGIEEGSELLDDLPSELDIPPAVFSEAYLGVPSPPSPTYPLERSVEKFRQADRIRGIARGDTIPELAEVVYERGAADDDLEVEYVLSSDLFEWYRERKSGKLSAVLSSENLEISVHHSAPVGVAVWDIDNDAEMQIVMYSDDGTFSGNIVSSHPVAVEWAHGLVSRYQREARPVTDFIE